MMKNVLILLFAFTLNLSYGQITLLNDGFESYSDFSVNSFGNWSSLDLDGLFTYPLGGDPAPPTNWYATWPHAYEKMAFQIFNPSNANVTNDASGTSGEIRNFDAHGGSKYAGCWGGIMVDSYMGNQDWLVSPAITLGSTSNELTLYLKTLSTSYGDERYRIGVYVGNGIPTSSADFTIISSDYSPTEPFQYAPSYWKKDTYSLNTYSSQTIRVGVYCMTQEGSMLMIDDIKVTTTGTVSTGMITTGKYKHSNNESKVFPNPAKGEINIETSKNISDIYIFNTVGQLVKTEKQNKFDISNLEKGIYTLKVNYTDKVSESIKLIKN
jgi:hypothetical protein